MAARERNEPDDQGRGGQERGDEAAEELFDAFNAGPAITDPGHAAKESAHDDPADDAEAPPPFG